MDSGSLPASVSAKWSQSEAIATPTSETIVIRKIDHRERRTNKRTSSTKGMSSRIKADHPSHSIIVVPIILFYVV
jgi:hypothetical protein